jgi:PAS domain-containing protein
MCLNAYLILNSRFLPIGNPERHMDSIEINKYWKRVIDTISDALLIIRTDGTVLAANRSFEEMTGYSATEITGPVLHAVEVRCL